MFERLFHKDEINKDGNGNEEHCESCGQTRHQQSDEGKKIMVDEHGVVLTDKERREMMEERDRSK